MENCGSFKGFGYIYIYIYIYRLLAEIMSFYDFSFN